MQARIRFVSIAILVVSLAMLIVSFATAERGGRTRFGTDLGADHAGFYTAGWILNHHRAVDLYDNEFQNRVHHELHPHLEPEVSLPFVHPPFVAVAFRPLAMLPYAWSFAIWLLISLSLYLVGLLVALRTTNLSAAERLTAVLAALSFEPFVMECWQGGQLSAVGFCCLAIAVSLDLSGRRFTSGLVLGLCLYKPTLLVVVVPFLLVTRRWRTLLGLTIVGTALALLSIACVGWDGTMAFVEKLLGFSQHATAAGPLELKTWKYVDLNAFTRLLVGGPGSVQQLLMLALAVPALAWILVRAFRIDPLDEGQTRLAWASVLLATPVINLYVGLYDSVLAVLGALWLVDGTRREFPQRDGHLTGWIAAIYLAPWITQPLAKTIHFQVFTLVLLAAALWACRVVRNRAN